jgi:hypothetical protein
VALAVIEFLARPGPEPAVEVPPQDPADAPPPAAVGLPAPR